MKVPILFIAFKLMGYFNDRTVVVWSFTTLDLGPIQNVRSIFRKMGLHEQEIGTLAYTEPMEVSINPAVFQVQYVIND